MSLRLLAVAALLGVTPALQAQVVTFTGKALDLQGNPLPTAQFNTLTVTVIDDAGNLRTPAVTRGADGRTYTFTFDPALVAGITRGLRIEWSAAGRVPARIDRAVIPAGALAAADLTQTMNVALPTREEMGYQPYCCPVRPARHRVGLFGCHR